MILQLRNNHLKGNSDWYFHYPKIFFMNSKSKISNLISCLHPLRHIDTQQSTGVFYHLGHFEGQLGPEYFFGFVFCA